MVNQTMISAVLGIERGVCINVFHYLAKYKSSIQICEWGVCINVFHYLAKVTVQKQHSDM